MWLFPDMLYSAKSTHFREYIIFQYWQNVFAGRIWPVGGSLEAPALNNCVIIIYSTTRVTNDIESFLNKILTTFADILKSGIPNLFTISYHLDTSYCQRVPLLPEKLNWSNLSLFRRIICIKITIKTTTKFNEIFVFVYLPPIGRCVA